MDRTPRGRRRRRGLVSTVALVLASCSSGAEPTAGTSSGADSGDTTATTPAVGAATTSTTATGAIADSTTSTIVASAPPTPPEVLGDIEVSMTTRLPRLDLTWVATELEVGAADELGVWLAYVGVVDGEAVAVAISGTSPDRQAVRTFRSSDGEAWAHTDWMLAAGDSFQDVASVDGRLVATGHHFDDAGIEFGLWTATSAGDWELVDLRAAGIDPSGVSASGYASSEAGIVIGARRDGNRSTTIAFESQGYRYEQDEWTATYELIDVATGQVVSTGSTAEMYSWNEDGQAVWNLDTGELLTVIPWEIWAGAPVDVSPLPIPVPSDQPDVDVQVVEWDGWRVTLDLAADRVEVAELATGEIVSSSTSEAFHRGPSPSFVDDVSGESVVSFTWPEWDLLLAGAYESTDRASGASELLVLFSPDGDQWTATGLGEGVETYVESMWAAADRFHLSIVEYTGGESTRTVRVSPDGITWDNVEVASDQGVGPVASGEGGAIAISWSTTGLGQPTLSVSEDGSDWTPVLFVGPQDDGRSAWLQLVASGELGRAALVTVDPPPVPIVMTIAVGTRTARFNTVDAAVEITDDQTGAVVLTATWDELQQATLDGASPIVTHADGVTTFWSPDGAPVMAIADAAVEAAFLEQDRQYQASIDRAVFLELGGRWYEAGLPSTGGAWPERLAVGDTIVLVGAVRYTSSGPDPTVAQLVVLVGRLD